MVTPVPIRPRSRGERRSLRTFSTFSPGFRHSPPTPRWLGFNPDTPRRRLSTNSASDAVRLHPDDVRRFVRTLDPQSARRPGGSHFDLTFVLRDPEGNTVAFADCDATGQYAPGKEQPILRSKIAVARFLERDGMSTEVRFVSFRFVSFFTRPSVSTFDRVPFQN